MTHGTRKTHAAASRAFGHETPHDFGRRRGDESSVEIRETFFGVPVLPSPRSDRLRPLIKGEVLVDSD
jgi:hypothetical protein